MAESNGKTRCIDCNKDKATMKCGGCSQDFCYKHLKDHRQDLNKQLDEIETNHDIFRQSITQHFEQPNKHFLIQQINQWEQKSIKLIKKTADDAKQLIIKNMNPYIHQLEKKLNKLTEELRESRNEDDFNEINLRHFQEELDQLTKELNQPSNILIQENSTSFISKITVHVSSKSDDTLSINDSKFISNIHYNSMWTQYGITVAGGNGSGNALNQLYYPFSVYVPDDDQTIYVADFINHRIVEWRDGATKGQTVAGGNGEGNQMNQLNHPTDVIVDNEKQHLIICDYGNKRVVRWSRQKGIDGRVIISNIHCRRLTIDNNDHLYISDSDKHEVRRWKIGDTTGTLVAGGNGKGNGLDQLNEPNFIFVDENHSVYVSDLKNHRVVKWMKGAQEGIIVAGGRGPGTSLGQLSSPKGLLVDHLGTIYVADGDNHRIMRWYKGATQGDILLGGSEKGQQANQLNSPQGLSFDRQGNLYVVDWNNHRVQRFNINRS